MAIYAIGDIHGHTALLDCLVSNLDIGDDDTLLFTGDYVDKGPDMAGTLDLLISYKDKLNCVFLRGNHDQAFVEACQDQQKVPIWECLAGSNPLGSYSEGSSHDVITKVPSKHIDFLKNDCVNYYETDDFIFVHAGLRSDVLPSDESLERLHWSQVKSAGEHKTGKTVVCGHSSQRSGQILDLGHTICIDTAVTRGKALTCLKVDDFSYTQVSHDLSVSNGHLRK